MEQVIKLTAKQEDHICTHPPGVSSVWSNHPLTGRLHPSPCHRTPVPLSPLQPQVYNEARSRGSLVEGAWHGFHSVRTASLLRNLWAQLRAEGSLGGKTIHVDKTISNYIQAHLELAHPVPCHLCSMMFTFHSKMVAHCQVSPKSNLLAPTGFL